MSKIKALSVLDCRVYITEKFGAEAHEKIKAVMNNKHRDIVYAEGILPVSWLDLEAVVEHLITFDRVCGNGDGRTGDAMIRHLADRHYKGIYSIMFKNASTKEVVKKSRGHLGSLL
jgi:hypothetical protein